MVVRLIVGVSWSLITGLAGGWLLFSPWALGEQSSSGDWTTVTKTQFWTGAGLIAIAVICLAVLAAQVAQALRGVPGAATATNRGRSAPAVSNVEMDAALVSLANALVADLNRQPASAPSQYHQAPPQPPTVPPAVQPNGPPSPYPQVPQPPASSEPWRPGR